MMAAVPNSSDAVTQYASRCLCLNVKFSVIEKLRSQQKHIHPSFICFQITNIFLKMRYWEGQVDYCGKIGMSLLVFM